MKVLNDMVVKYIASNKRCFLIQENQHRIIEDYYIECCIVRCKFCFSQPTGKQSVHRIDLLNLYGQQSKIIIYLCPVLNCYALYTTTLKKYIVLTSKPYS